MNQSHWYCLHTKPRAETQVSVYCRDRLAVEIYYPRLRQVRLIRRVRQTVIGPLFPRYLFCRFSPDISYRAVRYAPDVIDIVQRGGQPAIVPDSLIAELRLWAGDVLDAGSLHPTWHPGESVTITDGPLAGVSGVILHLRNDQERVELLLSLLDKSAHVTVHRHQIAPALPSSA